MGLACPPTLRTLRIGLSRSQRLKALWNFWQELGLVGTEALQ